MRPSALRTVALSLVGVAAAAWLFARFVWLARGRLPATARESRLALGDGTELAVARISLGRDHVVILAHGFLKRKDDRRMLRLAEGLLRHFDVILYDQPGHGESTGVANLDLTYAGDCLKKIAVEARRVGYARVSAVGVSLGAAAAINAAASGAPLDAIVSISSPVGPAWVPERAWMPGIARVWYRSLGTLVGDRMTFAGWPLAVVADVAPARLLIVHCGRDTLIPLAASQALYSVASEPKSWLLDERALHGTPNHSHSQIVAWLEETCTESKAPEYRGRPI
jgi:pimeloyl-ACP methyl ester carboxylesterase